MNDLFLIAHKVRGQPAFDIAERHPCAVCHADPNVVDFIVPTTEDCHECEGLGYWWNIPTTGHRAYPYWDHDLDSLGVDLSYPGEPEFERVMSTIPPMPPSLRDHYEVTTTKAEKAKPSPSALLAKLGLGKAKEPIKRRV
jgi:hypothetical protein